MTEPNFFIDTLSGRLSVAGNRVFYDHRRTKRVHISSYPSPIELAACSSIATVTVAPKPQQRHSPSGRTKDWDKGQPFR